MIIEIAKISDETKRNLTEEIAKLVNSDQSKIKINSIEFSINDILFNLEELEKVTLIKALSQTTGNITKTAKLLGVTRRTIYAMIKKHSIDTFLNINDK